MESESHDVLDSRQLSSKAKTSRNGTLAHDEIATEAAAMLYRIITSFLYGYRQTIRSQLFLDVLYVFTDCGHHGAHVNQQTLQLKW